MTDHQASSVAPASQIHSGQLTPQQDIAPGVISIRCPTAQEVIVTYDKNVDRSDITDYAIEVLKEVCSSACISSVNISSGVRSADSQAQAMYGNARTRGIERERHLYGREGNFVLDQYQLGVEQGLDVRTIKENMAAVIRQYPDAFHHVQRAPNLSVFDVSPRSVEGGSENAGKRLVSAARADSRVVRFFQPPNDAGYHFEIENP
jgi:hypothetical protein